MSATLRRSSLWLGLPLVAAALAPSPPDEAAALSANAKNRSALARESLRLLDERLKVGELSFSDPRFYTWSRRMIEAYDSRPAGDADRIAAIKSHVDRMREELHRASRAHETGRFTTLDVNEAKFRLLEAETWLAKAESK